MVHLYLEGRRVLELAPFTHTHLVDTHFAFWVRCLLELYLNYGTPFLEAGPQCHVVVHCHLCEVRWGGLTNLLGHAMILVQLHLRWEQLSISPIKSKKCVCLNLADHKRAHLVKACRDSSCLRCWESTFFSRDRRIQARARPTSVLISDILRMCLRRHMMESRR